MISNNGIKAILFDSGNVLNYPKTGNWFIPPNFYKYIDKVRFESLERNTIKSAFGRVYERLMQQHLVLSELEEHECFIRYYDMLLNEQLELEVDKKIIIEIAKDNVYNDEKFVFYADTFEVIPELSQQYKLGVVSDTWPSLERVFRNVGLRDYFSTFVMSSMLGVNKPERFMFETALRELGVRAQEVLFIDDSVRNVEGARAVGINSILMLRSEVSIDDKSIYISNLRDLQSILAQRIS